MNPLYENLYNKDNTCLLVAKVEDKIVGYLFGFLLNSGDSVILTATKLDALFVLEEFRKKGIASALVNEFKCWVIQKQARFIELKACKGNDEAIKLYNKLGFKNTKIIMSLHIEDERVTI